MKQLRLAGTALALSLFISACAKSGGIDASQFSCDASLSGAGAAPAAEMSKETFVHPLSMNQGVKRFLVKMRPLAPGEVRPNSIPVNAKPATQPVNEEWKVVEVKDGGDPQALVQELMATPGVAAVEPDFEMRTNAVVPRDPGYSRQWAHQKVDSGDAWEMTKGSSSVVVAIIDGGVEITHPDLAANIWTNPREVVNGRDDDGNGYIDDVHGWDFIHNDSNPKADSTSHIHGTHVAGIIGAVEGNGLGIVGHSPHVRLMPLKYIDSNGTGNTSDAVRAIDYAVRNGAHIINASWSSTSYSQALYDAIARAKDRGVLFVVAAGNDGVNIDRTARYPASFNLPNIVSVGATTSSDMAPNWSDYGMQNVDVSAPGSSIYSTRTGSAYTSISGTSMAAPLVTGIAALIKARHFSFDYRKIASALFLGVDRVSSLAYKVRFGGRVNAYKSLLAADDLASGRRVISEQGLLCPGS